MVCNGKWGYIKRKLALWNASPRYKRDTGEMIAKISFAYTRKGNKNMPAVGFKKDVQFKFYATRSGLTNVKSLRDHMRAYYVLRIGGPAASVKTLSDLEKQWLRLVITTAGGTPVSNYLSMLWKQAVAIKGLTATNMVEENQITYWSLVTSVNGL